MKNLIIGILCLVPAISLVLYQMYLNTTFAGVCLFILFFFVTFMGLEKISQYGAERARKKYENS